MASVKLSVLRIVDTSQPFFVECELVDCNGIRHHFVDKLPVFVANENTYPPCMGKMRCTIIETTKNTVVIDTSSPDDLESTNGNYQFEVFKEQIL